MMRIIINLLLVGIICWLPFCVVAQTNATLALRFTENNTEIRFYIAEKPEKTVFILPKNRPILSIANAEIKTLKQHLGSVKLKWNIGKTEDFYFDTIEKPTTNNLIKITIKSKKQVRDFSVVLYDGGTTYHIDFVDEKATFLKANIKNYQRFTWHIPLFENESIYGGGEQFSFVKLNGHKIPFLVEEQGIGRGDMPISFLTKFKNASGSKATTFMPIARFVTSHQRHFESTLSTYQEFDFTKKNYVDIHQFIGKETFVDVFVRFTLDTSSHWNIVPKTQRLSQPDWMFRTILGLQGGTDTVLQKLKILTDAGVQPSALWTQDWCGRRVTPFGKQLLWNWQLDTLRYPRFTTFRDGLRQKNIRLLGYINPFLAEGTVLDKEAVTKDSYAKKNLYLHTSYLVADHDLKPFLMEATGFNVHLLDVCNYSANDWILGMMQKNLVDNGFSGWMADFGEWYPFVWANTTSIFDQHNQYPNGWNQIQEAICRKNADTLGIFMRSTTQPFGHIYWAGDQNTNWQKNDGLPSLVPALLSSGLSGIAINHGDIGGFTSFKKGIFKMTRSRELLYRWIELCAFTPIFRTHEGLAPDYNMQVYSDTASAKFFARFSKIHDELHPYIMRTYRETETLHLPMVRHLILHFPDDPNVADLAYQFMLGSDLLVAPVLQKGAKTVRAYLPKGKWRHFFTQKIIESKGEWRVLDAPIGQPAAFWLVAE